MKKLLLFGYFLCILIALQATSCNKNQTPVDPTVIDTMPCPDTVETLPPKTQKGSNTFACLVNGEVWLARVGEYFGNSPEEFEGNRILYGNQGNINDPNFKIRKYRRYSNSCDTVSSFISFSVNNVDLGEKLPIRNSWVFNDSYNCRDFDKLPWEDHYVIVDYLDTINQIIAGRFAFTAVNHCTPRDTVVVTEGRFDMHYEKFD